jgi:hypothetical protein
MTFPNIFQSKTVDQLTERINKFDASTKPQWGRMNASQMLAHVNVAYEMSLEDNHKKPGAFQKFMIKLFAKSAVCGPKPYPKNGRTAPQFVISDERDFEKEKARLISYLNQCKELGEKHFDGKESHSFGKLTLDEWNTMFYKHLDHHFTQFGV